MGYVHSDLRPSNAVWLPNSSRWTLAGLGNVIRKGANVPLATRTAASGFAFVAPEALSALLQGTPSVPASPLHDAWALGVLVFQVLTGRTLIEACGGADEVRPLHWHRCSLLCSRRLRSAGTRPPCSNHSYTRGCSLFDVVTTCIIHDIDDSATNPLKELHTATTTTTTRFKCCTRISLDQHGCPVHT
jgi:serine/threonine protein kinase